MDELGKWATNAPKHSHAPRLRLPNDTRSADEERADYLRWRSQFIEGPPKAGPGDYTVERLKAMGMVGLYWPAEVKEEAR